MQVVEVRDSLVCLGKLGLLEQLALVQHIHLDIGKHNKISISIAITMIRSSIFWYPIWSQYLQLLSLVEITRSGCKQHIDVGSPFVHYVAMEPVAKH